MKRARWMISIVVFGLFVSGVTVWPAIPGLTWLVDLLWGDAEAGGVIHAFLLRSIEGLEYVQAHYAFLFYAHDWLAFAHICLAILFAGTLKDPVRNKWVIQCGLIMCALIPVLAAICIPLRGIPFAWFFVDFAFAPAAALPLWIALKDINQAERQQRER